MIIIIIIFVNIIWFSDVAYADTIDNNDSSNPNSGSAFSIDEELDSNIMTFFLANYSIHLLLLYIFNILFIILLSNYIINKDYKLLFIKNIFREKFYNFFFKYIVKEDCIYNIENGAYEYIMNILIKNIILHIFILFILCILFYILFTYYLKKKNYQLIFGTKFNIWIIKYLNNIGDINILWNNFIYMLLLILYLNTLNISSYLLNNIEIISKVVINYTNVI